MKNPLSSFFLSAFITLITLGLCVALININFDPYSVFRSNLDNETYPQKPNTSAYILNYPRAMALALKRNKVDTLLLGSSRVLHGLSTEHPLLGSQRAFNGGYASASIDELADFIDFVAKYSSVKRIIVGLDFTGFYQQEKRPHVVDYKLAENPLNPYKLSDFIGSEALQNSVMMGKGFETRFGRSNTLGRYQHLNYHLDNFIYYLRKFTTIYCQRNYDHSRLESLEKALNTAKEKQIELITYFSPIHESMVNALTKCGKVQDFKRWKHGIVSLFDEAANTLAAPVIWDFSGYNSITSEKIPPKGNKKPMQWYLDASHFSKATGDLMLTTMLSTTAKPVYDFGVKLNQQNIAKHLLYSMNPSLQTRRR